MKLKILLIAWIGLSCSPKEQKLPVQFWKEEVLLEIDSDEVRVEGKYYFKNRTQSSKIMKLFYPFPIDESHFYPYYMEVVSTTGVENIPFEQEENGITFIVKLKPFEVKEVMVRYFQKISVRYAKYILVTARKWEEPIEEAKFIVSMPKEFEPSISYKPDSIVKENARVLYYIEERNLFPSSDLIISWK